MDEARRRESSDEQSPDWHSRSTRVTERSAVQNNPLRSTLFFLIFSKKIKALKWRLPFSGPVPTRNAKPFDDDAAFSWKKRHKRRARSKGVEMICRHDTLDSCATTPNWVLIDIKSLQRVRPAVKSKIIHPKRRPPPTGPNVAARVSHAAHDCYRSPPVLNLHNVNNVLVERALCSSTK